MREIKKEQIWVDKSELSGHWKVDKWEYWVVKDIKKGFIYTRQVYLYANDHEHEGWMPEKIFRRNHKWVMN